MEPILATLATTAVVEGVKFLYKEAGEVLSAWRKRRQDQNAAPPKVLEPPAEVTVGNASPLADPEGQSMVDTLQELKDLAEQVKDGQLPPDSQEARAIVADLRELLEAILRAPITFAGESPRTLRIADVKTTVEQVSGRVAGVRANLDKLQGATEIRDVDVKAGDVQSGGDVTGVDLV